MTDFLKACPGARYRKILRSLADASEGRHVFFVCENALSVRAALKDMLPAARPMKGVFERGGYELIFPASHVVPEGFLRIMERHTYERGIMTKGFDRSRIVVVFE